MVYLPAQGKGVAAAVMAALLLGGCSSLGSTTHFSMPCNTGTQVQLAGPSPSQSGVSPSIGQIIMVANGNSNQLYNTYSQWQITLVDNFGNPVTGGSLQLVSDPSGPHPYPSDFYYGSSIPQLNAGRTYNAYVSLNNGSCQPVSLGSFST
jgi:hypothetical protein